MSNAYDENPPLVHKAHDMFVSYVLVPRTEYIGMNASFSPPSPFRPWSSAFDDAFAGLSRSFSYRGRTLEHSVVGTRRLCQMAQESAPKFCTRIQHCNSPIRSCIQNLYVACTRAKEVLYIIAPEGENDSVFMKMLKDSI